MSKCVSFMQICMLHISSVMYVICCCERYSLQCATLHTTESKQVKNPCLSPSNLPQKYKHLFELFSANFVGSYKLKKY